jgi:hypothetical protein
MPLIFRNHVQRWWMSEIRPLIREFSDLGWSTIFQDICIVSKNFSASLPFHSIESHRMYLKNLLLWIVELAHDSVIWRLRWHRKPCHAMKGMQWNGGNSLFESRPTFMYDQEFRLDFKCAAAIPLVQCTNRIRFAVTPQAQSRMPFSSFG